MAAQPTRRSNYLKINASYRPIAHIGGTVHNKKEE